MHDPQDWEIIAVHHGGSMGGEYLESINKSDLSQLTEEEWQTFLTVVCLNYHAEHNRLKPCPF